MADKETVDGRALAFSNNLWTRELHNGDLAEFAKLEAARAVKAAMDDLREKVEALSDEENPQWDAAISAVVALFPKSDG